MENQRIEMEQMKYRDGISVETSKQCIVVLNSKVKRNDFVHIRDENNCPQVARIEQLFGDLAHVILYIRARDLPPDTKKVSSSGHKIKFLPNEVVEHHLQSKNIHINAICGPAKLFKARENETLNDIQLHKNCSMAYICRYKLVKETIYKLVPVSWKPGEEELRHTADFSDFDEQNMYTDTDDQSEAVLDLCAEIDNLHTSLTSESPLISPFKIVNNSVQKVPRSCSQSSKKRSSPDPTDNHGVSPSKRNKFINESNYRSESPTVRNKKISSPAPSKVDKIRKNLNDSFVAPDDDDDDATMFTSRINEEEPMKIRILRERNDIKSDDFPKRRSILRKQEATKNTRRSVMIVESQKDGSNAKVSSETPSRRKSTRLCVENTKQKILLIAEDSTPEIEKRSTRKSMVKQTSPPSTPKRLTARRVTELQTPQTPKLTKTPKTPKSQGVLTPQQTRSAYRSGNLTPSIQSRQECIGGEQTELEMVRERLQVSAVPSSLPCRDREFNSIYEFITGKLTDGTSGCIYISGVPGTGETATVTQVIKTIISEPKSKKLPAFDFVDINGMRLTEPRQAYVQIYRQLTGKTLAWAQARDLLETRFTAGSKKSIRPTVLLVDELDIICNRKQDVVYNLFDWTVRKGARLIAITIANTMDLPERVLKLKVASRLGLTRITFQPYNFKQLQEVVMTRLAGSKCFMADAVQLVARKVASVSGDCRRALDICRRATEIAEEKDGKGGKGKKAAKIEVNFVHINQALSEMFASPKVRAIKSCTNFEKLFLQAVASEITRTGIEEVEFQRVYWQIGTLAPVLGLKNPPNEDQAMMICMALAANRLIIAEDSSVGLYQKIILNATVDDLYYALNVS